MKRERAKMLAPLNIQKDNVEAKMVQNGNVTVVEPDYLSKNGIFLNNSKGSSKSDFESKIEKDISDLKNKNGPNSSDSKYSNGYNNYGLNNMKNYENEKIQNNKYGNQNQFIQDQDGFAIPQSKSSKQNNLQNNNQYPSNNFNMMYEPQINFQQQQQYFSNNFNSQPEQSYQYQNNQQSNIQEEFAQEEEKDDELRLEDLESLGLIGAGSQGHVEKCIHKPSNSLIALKVILFYFIYVRLLSSIVMKIF